MVDGSVEVAPGAPIIVGVGASAGGLEALQRLFDGVTRNGSLAFVVVQHLSPDFKSLMDELLSRHTDLTIHRAEHGMLVEPDSIYLMPPKKEMIISGGRLLLTERDPDAELSLPIDVFFRSLAEDAGARGVAVVLSGTGTDGSRGLRNVHEAGGLVIAQSEDSAKFDGMPRAAVDTGVVDWVLPPEGISAALLRFAEHDGEIRQPQLDELPLAEEPMSRIFDLLRKESGVDFSGYKSGTIRRRIERRLLLSESLDLETYAARLARDPLELHSLYKDLLIGVTRFFRDPEAFDRIKDDVLIPLIRKLDADEELRIWVPGCASGEEPYSLAIVAHEAFRALGRTPSVRVFATDVHRPSLEKAGNAAYTAESVAGLPEAMIERYFVRHGETYHASTELRSGIVFAHHNVLRDAPFTRVDLVSCRNLLIYFKPATQRKAISLFHFALKTGGVMVLGPSETPGPLADEFEPIDPRWKIFRKRRDVRLLAAEMRVQPNDGGARVNTWRPRTEEEHRLERARLSLLERYAPPAILVESGFNILHTFGGANEYLRQRDGRPSLNLLDLLHGELRFVVAGALRRAVKEEKPVSYAGVEVERRDRTEKVSLTIERIPPGPRTEEMLLVIFEPEPEHAGLLRTDVVTTDLGELARDRITSLELELRQTKEHLQATVEQMESGNEELQATNEELIASNEELQSTNEELHSVNEELYTVNAEYQAKIAELTEVTQDMNHLLESTEVHTLFLDRELRLRKFTRGIADTFNLIPQDIGRRIDGFAHSLDDDELVSDLTLVLESGQVVEREVRDRRGRFYLLRILPYRSGPSPDGVVLTLVDISSLKRTERELKESEERYRTLVRAVTSILWTTDAQGRFVEPQREWQDYTGQPWGDHRGLGWIEAIHPDDRDRFRQLWAEAIERREPFGGDGRLWRQSSGDYRHFTVRAAPLFDDHGEIREWVGNMVDVHETKVVEVELKKKDEQLKGILQNAPAFIYLKDRSGKYLLAGRQCDRVLGVPCEEVVGKTDHDFLAASVADAIRASERTVLQTQDTVEVEEVIPIDGEDRTFLSVKFPLKDERGEPYAVAGIASDITELRRAAEEDRRALEQRDRFIAMLSHELRTPLGAIVNAGELLELIGDKTNGPVAPVEIIRRQARQMARLLDDLLDVARIRRDKLVIQRDRVELLPVVEAAVDALRRTAEQRKLTLEHELPDQPLMVIGDAARLQQVVSNLINNAVKFTSSGKIHVSVKPEGAQVRISVQDSGRGMTEEQLQRAFDLFYQSTQPADRPLGGLGVGLTLAQRLVHLHGGTISAHSDGPGTGCRFDVLLPVAKGAVVTPVDGADGKGKRRLSIVLVEDSADIRESTRALLEHAGHSVVAAGNGLDGISTILERLPDVALVDIGLPGIDGYEVARRVRETCGGGIRIFALTGYGRNEDRVRAIEAGFDEHLVKPVDPSRLSRLLAEVAAGELTSAPPPASAAKPNLPKSSPRE